MRGGPKKTPECDNVERRSMCQNVRLFIRSKAVVLNVASCLNIICISSDKPYYAKIPSYSSMTFNYCTRLLQNSRLMLIMNVSRLTGIQHVYHVP